MGLSRARGTWAVFCVPGPRRGPSLEVLPGGPVRVCRLLVRKFKNPKRGAHRRPRESQEDRQVQLDPLVRLRCARHCSGAGATEVERGAGPKEMRRKRSKFRKGRATRG